MTAQRPINANPYLRPYNGDLGSDNTVLMIIDMQTDFREVGGYVGKMGYDLSMTQASIVPIKRVLAQQADWRFDRRSRVLRK